MNRLVGADHPLASSLDDELFNHDPVGNRLSSHLSSSHTHDAANRLLDDDAFTYTYDSNGNLASKTEKAGGDTTSYTYDAEDQLVRIDFAGGGFAEYKYDNGDLQQVTDSDSELEFAYDEEGRLVQATSGGPGLTQPQVTLDYAYSVLGSRESLSDSLNRRSKLIWPTGIETRYSYDAASQLLSLVHDRFGDIIAKSDYAYDSTGNRTANRRPRRL